LGPFIITITIKNSVRREYVSEKRLHLLLNVYKFLCAEKREFVLSKQLLRSGTTIGANIEEAIGGVSDKDFISKLSVAYKETRETIYWLKLLQKLIFLSQQEFESLFNDAEEICKILGKIQLTLKARNS
jgi:four helix bundle protein